MESDEDLKCMDAQGLRMDAWIKKLQEDSIADSIFVGRPDEPPMSDEEIITREKELEADRRAEELFLIEYRALVEKHGMAIYGTGYEVDGQAVYNVKPEEIDEYFEEME